MSFFLIRTNPTNGNISYLWSHRAGAGGSLSGVTIIDGLTPGNRPTNVIDNGTPSNRPTDTINGGTPSTRPA